MATRAAISNPQVAALIDMSPTSVSRLRSGERHPSVMTMIEICEVFNWSIANQAYAYAEDNYHLEFEKVLIEQHGVADVDPPS